MKKLLTILTCAFLFAPTAFAEELIIELPDGVEISNKTLNYKCDNEQVTATYINAGKISLAQLHFKDDTIIAANVVAASGAKYAGAEYIWWTDKDGATLYNLIEDLKQEKPITCTALPLKED